MNRSWLLEKVNEQFKVHRVCALIGPRQVGKTTLAEIFIDQEMKGQSVFFDLENPLDKAQLENPLLTLRRYQNRLIVIDEVQLLPDLFPILRVLVDDKKGNYRFLVLGSASRDLLRQSAESLAGRIGYIEVPPFGFKETDDQDRLWMRGGFPRSYLALTEKESFLWREAYITTFLERDIPSLGFQIPPQQMRRFWLMLSHYHGQIFNASELGRSLGVSDHTVKRYLDILAGTFMVRVLTPWFENLKKRQIKSSKVYFRDTGILYGLLGFESEESLYQHPRLGAFWEGFALEEVIKSLQIKQEECFFWGTQGGAELDLFVMRKGKRLGFEFKFTENPRITRSMEIAMHDLQLDHLYLVYPGKEAFPLGDKMTALNPLFAAEEVEHSA